MVLYMCCTNDKYELPICISEDSTEIDRIMGRTKGNTLCCISRSKSGIYKEKGRYKFERIEIEDDPEFAEKRVCEYCGKEFLFYPHASGRPRKFCDEHKDKKYASIARRNRIKEEKERAQRAEAQKD